MFQDLGTVSKVSVLLHHHHHDDDDDDGDLLPLKVRTEIVPTFDWELKQWHHEPETRMKLKNTKSRVRIGIGPIGSGENLKLDPGSELIYHQISSSNIQLYVSTALSERNEKENVARASKIFSELEELGTMSKVRDILPSKVTGTGKNPKLDLECELIYHQ